MGRRMVPFRRVYVQPEIVEEGERDVLQLHGRCERLGEEREVVYEWKQPGSRESPLPMNSLFLCLACFSDRARRLWISLLVDKHVRQLLEYVGA